MDTTDANSRALLSGGLLGTVLLAWLLLTLFAPGLGMVIAVFGSPVFAVLMLLRLLTLPAADGCLSGSVSTLQLPPEAELLARVSARSSGRCQACNAAPAECLRRILPIGARAVDFERRMVALCPTCFAIQTGVHPARA